MSDWRSRSRGARSGDGQLLAFALIAAVTGVLLAELVPTAGSPWNSMATLLPLWAGLTAPVVLLLARSRPTGLLRMRATDLVWGVGLGLAVRLVQGALEGANRQPFPTTPTAGGPFSGDWWLEQGLAAGVVGPVVEEFFFRAVILVTVYRLLRRRIGAPAASASALLVSAGTFVLIHQAFAPLSLAAAFQLTLLGGVCAAVVLLTGRIWGAVLVHVVYNATFLGLGVMGSLLS